MSNLRQGDQGEDRSEELADELGKMIAGKLAEQGYSIVPKKPTAAMIEAGCIALLEATELKSVERPIIEAVWRTMIEASETEIIGEYAGPTESDGPKADEE